MGDLPQIIPINSSNAKKALLSFEFGIGGILFGLIFLVLGLVILNYTKIIDLSFVLPKNIATKLPQKNLTVQEKAKKIEYATIWIGDPNDTTGRAILLSKNRGLQNALLIDTFNLVSEDEVIMGTFKSLQQIPGSNDIYFILNNPLNSQEVKIRIKTKITQKEKKNPYTDFIVDNLSIKPTEKNNFGMEKLFAYNGLDEDMEKIKKIIRSGVVVRVWLNGYVNTDASGKPEKVMLKDEKNIVVAAHISIRRFGGKEQINTELKQ